MKQNSGSFPHPLQSRQWGEFRQMWGNEVVWTEHGLLTIHRIPLTTSAIGMFIKGPVPTQQMLDDLKKLAKQKNLIFIKLEPNVPIKIGDKLQVTVNKLKELLTKNGAVPGKTLFTPTTFWIDLTKSEEELLANFHPKTRYNIRVAQKKKVQVQEDDSREAFEKYLELMQETIRRQGFYAHTEKYHRLMWQFLHKQFTSPKHREGGPIARLLVAKYQGEIITTWILFAYKDFLYYPYGASSEKYKNVMANNLMMWEAIRLGKKLGLTTFDLWGREEGKGFTKFKEGYNPLVIEFLGTWDLVVNKSLYTLYTFAESARWKILRIKANVLKTNSDF